MLKSCDSYQDLQGLCEEDVIKKLETRQGYAARLKYDMVAPAPMHRTFTDQVTAEVWRVRLQMSNPRMELGGPLVARNPSTAGRPLDKRTSFHQVSVNCGHGREMLPINYLIKKPDSLPVPSFVKRFKNVSDALAAPYPRLNPDGEQMWTMLKRYEKGGFQQVRLADLPFMPEVVDVNEDIVLIESWLRAGAQWIEVLASMDEDERQYYGYYANQNSRARSGLQLEAWREDDGKKAAQGKGVTKAWTDADLRSNSGRGKVPGLIDPTLPQYAANWVPYPTDYRDPRITRDKNLKDQSVQYQRKSADARNAMLLVQNGHAPVASASDVLAKSGRRRRVGEEARPNEQVKRSRKAFVESRAAPFLTDELSRSGSASDFPSLPPRRPIGASDAPSDPLASYGFVQDPNERSAAIQKFTGQRINGDSPMAKNEIHGLQINPVRSPPAQQTGHVIDEQPLSMIYNSMQQHGHLTAGEEHPRSFEGLSGQTNDRLRLSIQTRSPTNEPSLDGSMFVVPALYASPDADVQDQPAAGWTSDDAADLLLELERELGPWS